MGVKDGFERRGKKGKKKSMTPIFWKRKKKWPISRFIFRPASISQLWSQYPLPSHMSWLSSQKDIRLIVIVLDKKESCLIVHKKLKPRASFLKARSASISKGTSTEGIIFFLISLKTNW